MGIERSIVEWVRHDRLSDHEVRAGLSGRVLHRRPRRIRPDGAGSILEASAITRRRQSAGNGCGRLPAPDADHYGWRGESRLLSHPQWLFLCWTPDGNV